MIQDFIDSTEELLECKETSQEEFKDALSTANSFLNVFSSGERRYTPLVLELIEDLENKIK